MNRIQITAGAALLLFGLAVYALARSPVSSNLPAALQLSTTWPWLERLSGSTPTFAHTAALALITTGVLGGARGCAWTACSAWTSINVLLEFCQHPYVRLQLVGRLPDWIERAWLFGQPGSYFMNGTFDDIDILAALLGGIAAFLIIAMTSQRLSKEIRT